MIIVKHKILLIKEKIDLNIYFFLNNYLIDGNFMENIKISF